jgi:hypothetical protein
LRSATSCGDSCAGCGGCAGGVPPQRTYLKLRNPSKLTVQEIQVDIVNAEETVVGDLLDTTYVSLHIK